MAFLSAGAVLQTAAYGVPQLIVGRIVTGIGTSNPYSVFQSRP